MKNSFKLLLGLVMLASVYVSLPGVHAVTTATLFDSMNSTVGLNQNAFFNISADFPRNGSYVIYLNNVSVASGTIPAYTTTYETVKYNVTNTLSGTYQPSIKFSAISYSLPSNTSLEIVPMSSFAFPGYLNYTTFYNGAGSLDIKVLNNGNTPLDFNWALPTLTGVSFTLVYQQSFSLEPDQLFSIPMNITITKSITEPLNFSFTATHQSISITKYYATTLISPVVNMSFFGSKISAGNGNTTVYTVQIKNGNSLSINTTFQFLLDINGNDFYYNKSYLISPSLNQISTPLPKSALLTVDVYYPAQNGSVIRQQIFNQPPPSSGSNGLIITIIYIIVMGAAVAVLLLLHIKFRNKRG